MENDNKGFVVLRTKEDIELDINNAKLELEKFEKEYAEVFKKHSELKSKLADCKNLLHNEIYMVGRCYKITKRKRDYDTPTDDTVFFINVKKSNWNSLCGDMVRVVPSHEHDVNFYTSRMINGGFQKNASFYDYEEITHEKFDRIWNRYKDVEIEDRTKYMML